MNRRVQIRLLVGLLVPLAVVAYIDIRPGAGPVGKPANDTFDLLKVENPQLRLDMLERLKQYKHDGSQRNIFSASVPPPPVAVAQKPVNMTPAPPTPPPGPPPLVVPAQFFGYVTDARTGARQAFFSDGEQTYVVGLGEVLLGRFRLVQIGNSTAELEETAIGQRAILAMEDQPAQLGQDQVGLPGISTAAGSSPFGSPQIPAAAIRSSPLGFPQIPAAAGSSPLSFPRIPTATGLAR
jgi:hypothetical protein